MMCLGTGSALEKLQLPPVELSIGGYETRRKEEETMTPIQIEEGPVSEISGLDTALRGVNWHRHVGRQVVLVKAEWHGRTDHIKQGAK